MGPNSYDTIASGLLHKLKVLKSISENISNVRTIGYKRSIPETLTFGSILNDVAKKDLSAGTFKKTNNKLDIAVEGNGFILVDSKDGPVTTRNGRLHVNEKGNLAIQEGNELIITEKTSKPINLVLSEDKIRINEKGEIFVGSERYGRIAMSILDNKPVKIHQGMIEGSNVNIPQEMISLEMAFRAVESSEKALGMQLSIDKELVEKYGKNV